MSLAATIRAAAALAFQAADDLVVSRRVRHTPTGTYNATTDAMVNAWAFDQDVPLVGYDDEAGLDIESKGTDNPDQRLRTFVFLATDLPTIAINSQAEVDDSWVTWKSYKVERDPAGATILIYCRP